MSTPWIAVVVALWVVVVMLSVVVIGLLRRVGNALEQAESVLASGVESAIVLGGVSVGSEVPQFRMFEAARGGRGQQISSAELIREPSLLLFMGAGCAPCRELAGQLAAAPDVLGQTPLHVILSEEDGLPDWLPTGVHVLHEVKREVTQAFNNIATPYAYVVDESHIVVAKRVIRSVADLQALVGHYEPAHA